MTGACGARTSFCTDALVDLMLAKGYDRVTVQDIGRANVGRSTFYTHFSDKRQLLTSGLEELRDSLPVPGTTARLLGFSLPLVQHAADNHRL